MADLIDVATFEARFGRDLSASEQTQVESFITDVSAQVVAEADGNLDDATSATVPDGIVPVIVAAVRRGLTNPDGYGQESVDSYSYSGAPRDGLFLTARERRQVRRAVGISVSSGVDLEGYLPSPASESVPSRWDSWL